VSIRIAHSEGTRKSQAGVQLVGVLCYKPGVENPEKYLDLPTETILPAAL
jgi:hypothetical protein